VADAYRCLKGLWKEKSKGEWEMVLKRRVIAIIIGLAMVVGLSPALAVAQNTNIALEEAIQKAKELFPVTAQYPNFVSQFSSSPYESSWNLQWEASEPDKGSLSVRVNAATGDIISMYHWTNVPASQSAPAVLSAQEAQKIADRWLHRVIPEKAANLQVVKNPNVIPLSAHSNYYFYFQYQRVENGVPVLGDGAYIELNGRTKDIISYSLTWTDLPLPDPSRVVPKAQAKKVFKDEEMLKMEYFLPQYWLLRSSDSEPQPVRLVYRIDHPSMGTIDALTGQPMVLSEGENERYANDLAMKEMAIGGRGSSEYGSLSPQEIAELKKHQEIITPEEAISLIKKWLDIPAQAQLNSAQLSVDWQNKDIRTWNLNWVNPNRTNDGDYYNIWARVDANTSRIYSFGKYSGDEYEKGTLTQEKATTIAQEFIKKIEPQLSKEVKLLGEAESWNVRPLELDSLPDRWSVAFTRQVNGVPFHYDGFRLVISGATGEITEYSLTWTEKEFIPVSQAMNSSQAYEIVLGLAPMTLCYTPISGSDGYTGKFMLAYKPLTDDGSREFAMIDAVSGKALNSMGEPLEKQPTAHNFDDIAGHFAEQEIRLIGQAGLMNEYGNQFRPDIIISNGEYLRAMLGAVDGVWYVSSLNEKEVIETCYAREWITEKVPYQDDLTRQMLTEVAIRSMGLEKVARHSSIFINPFPDDSSINESKVGYIALATAMDLLHVDKDFKAHEAVTRGEAAFTLIRSLHR
jgi:hypothetical protein